MSDYVPVIASIIAGLFATATGVIAWRLKSSTEERERSVAYAKEQRGELKRLYTDIFVMFEQAIKKVRQFEEFDLDKELSDVNARVRLFATKGVIEQYHHVAQLLAEWSILYAKASPRPVKIGGQTMVILQAPDPTAKYKEPEREAHESLQSALELLVNEMRRDLTND